MLNDIDFEKNSLHLISLGGCGGCGIRMEIEKIKNQLSYPYDWIVSSQNFVINSFFEYTTNFINFVENKFNISTPYHYNENTNVIDGIAIHDHYNHITYEKYKKRFERLHTTISNKSNKIVFIRLLTDSHNIASVIYSKINKSIQGYYYDDNAIHLIPNNDIIKTLEVINSFKNQPCQINKWIDFMKNITTHFDNKNCTLILFSDSCNITSKIDDNVYITKSYDWAEVKKILLTNI